VAIVRRTRWAPRGAVPGSGNSEVPLRAELGYFLNMKPERSGEPPSSRELLDGAIRGLRERLPDRWDLTANQRDPSSGNGPEASVAIRSPDARVATLVVAVRRTLGSRDWLEVAERLERQVSDSDADGALVVARYISPGTRERLDARGISTFDAAGNVHIRSDDPGLFISSQGAKADPWRGPGRRRDTLRGEPAARVVRTLVDRRGPWRVRRLIEASGASTGSVYRVVELLEAEALITRDGNEFVVPEWHRLLRRWAEDYAFQTTNRVSRWIAPRGLDDAMGRLVESGDPTYAVSGSVAAAAWEEYAPARSLWVYSASPGALADAIGLRRVDAGANVLIAEPAYAVAFDGVTTSGTDQLRRVAPAQAVADLLNGPGRAPSEGEHLMDWMERNERAWRLE
jgi:hypothetical protein